MLNPTNQAKINRRKLRIDLFAQYCPSSVINSLVVASKVNSLGISTRWADTSGRRLATAFKYAHIPLSQKEKSGNDGDAQG
jgi:hypothetical protein